MILGRRDFEQRIRQQQRTEDSLIALGQKLEKIESKVDEGNHWKPDIIDRLDAQDQRFEVLHQTVTEISDILTEMKATVLEPEELAAIGERARRDVFWKRRQRDNDRRVSVFGAWGSAIGPIIAIISLIVTVLWATGHLH